MKEMPLYDTVVLEKPPVVLDIGRAYTKLGFAVETHPRKIIPSEILLTNVGKVKNIFTYEDEQEFYDQLVHFLQMVFFRYLLVSPKERRIIYVENVCDCSLIRNTLAKALFYHFEVSSVLFLPSHLMALTTLATPHGVVIDIGYKDTTVMPVYCGVQILHAFQDQSYGGRELNAEVKRRLVETDCTFNSLLTEEMLEDIKIRTCFVTKMSRIFKLRENITPPVFPPTVEYFVNSEIVVKVPGQLREMTYEIFFEENNDHNNLPHLILKSILRCPIDIRRALMQNILIIGGSAIIIGLLPRLKEELEFLAINSMEYKNKLHAKPEFKFHKTICSPNVTSWVGASICGGTDFINTRSLTKEAYVNLGYIPDWIHQCKNPT